MVSSISTAPTSADRLLKNKLFFFANSERTSREQIAPVRLFSVPNDALRRGDFSGVGATIYDPASNPDPALRTPFPGNIIPANRIDPAAIEMINRLPLPNNGTSFVNNYQAQGTEDYERDNNDFKVTYQPGSNFTLFGRYSYSPSDIFDPPALGDAGGDALAGGQLGSAPGRTHIAGFGGTYTFSPRRAAGRQLRLHAPEARRRGSRSRHELRPRRVAHSRHQRARSHAKRHALVPGQRLGEHGQPEHRQSVPVQRQAVRVRTPTCRGSGARIRCAPGSITRISRSTTSSRRAAPSRPRAARSSSMATRRCSRTRRRRLTPASTAGPTSCSGLPSGAGKVEQLRNPNSVHMRVYAAVRARSVARHE